jgi:hypothetical protein
MLRGVGEPLEVHEVDRTAMSAAIERVGQLRGLSDTPPWTAGTPAAVAAAAEVREAVQR